MSQWLKTSFQGLQSNRLRHMFLDAALLLHGQPLRDLRSAWIAMVQLDDRVDLAAAAARTVDACVEELVASSLVSMNNDRRGIYEAGWKAVQRCVAAPSACTSLTSGCVPFCSLPALLPNVSCFHVMRLMLPPRHKVIAVSAYLQVVRTRQPAGNGTRNVRPGTGRRRLVAELGHAGLGTGKSVTQSLFSSSWLRKHEILRRQKGNMSAVFLGWARQRSTFLWDHQMHGSWETTATHHLSVHDRPRLLRGSSGVHVQGTCSMQRTRPDMRAAVVSQATPSASRLLCSSKDTMSWTHVDLLAKHDVEKLRMIVLESSRWPCSPTAALTPLAAERLHYVRVRSDVLAVFASAPRLSTVLSTGPLVTRYPDCIEQAGDTLRTLDLSYSRITAMPDSLGAAVGAAVVQPDSLQRPDGPAGPPGAAVGAAAVGPGRMQRPDGPARQPAAAVGAAAVGPVVLQRPDGPAGPPGAAVGAAAVGPGRMQRPDGPAGPPGAAVGAAVVGPVMLQLPDGPAGRPGAAVKAAAVGPVMLQRPDGSPRTAWGSCQRCSACSCPVAAA